MSSMEFAVDKEPSVVIVNSKDFMSNNNIENKSLDDKITSLLLDGYYLASTIITEKETSSYVNHSIETFYHKYIFIKK